MTIIDDNWREWIRHNLERGCTPESMVEAMVSRDIAADEARAEVKRCITEREDAKQLRSQAAVRAPAKPASPSSTFAGARRFANAKLELFVCEDFAAVAQVDAVCREWGHYDVEGDLLVPNGAALARLDARIHQYMGVPAAYCCDAELLRVEASHALGQFNKYQLRVASYGVGVVLGCEKGATLKCTSLEVDIALRAGMAFIWRLKPGAYGNRFSSNAEELPQLLGGATVLYKTFQSVSRVEPAPPFFAKTRNECLPGFSREGFWKTRVPTPLFEDILAFYRERQAQHTQEFVPGGYVHQLGASSGGSDLVELNDSLRKRIHDAVKPLMEQWSGTKLEPSTVYGIRIYRRDAVLELHRDRVETHVFGAIINVAQEVDEDWPLIMEDHFYRPHSVLLKPGDMLFYEGAKLTHGRPAPFQGNAFANIFCHFSPEGYMTGGRAPV